METFKKQTIYNKKYAEKQFFICTKTLGQPRDDTYKI